MRLILKLALMTVACLALLLTLFSWPQRPALAPAQASSYTGLIPVSTGAPAPHLLTGAPAATQVASQRPLVEGTAVARVDFSANSGLITVPVRVNGSQKELRMYLDTGMSAPVIVLFHKESIAELGLTSTQQVFLGGAGG